MPEVDLSNKPWFTSASTPPKTAAALADEEMTLAMRTVPLDSQRQMGHRPEDLLQECTWNGRKCSPRYLTPVFSFVDGNAKGKFMVILI